MAYQKNIKAVLEEYKVDGDRGLSTHEAEERLKQYGRNELRKEKKITLPQMLLEQFQDPMVIILIIGAVVSFFLKEVIDASIILVVIIMNAMIGVAQEFKAEKAIEALEKLSTPKAHVIREGFIREIDSSQLVIGDIVDLEVGCYIPADLRLISSHSLKIEESTLTGESEPVDKDATLLLDTDTGIADQRNMAFMSTFVTYGKGRGVVVATGMKSEVGKIAKLLDDTKEDKTPLQQRLAQLSKILGIGSVAICMIMFAVSLLQGRDIFDMLLLSISLAVAAIPEGLPAVVTIVLALGVQVMSKNHAIVRKLHAVETLGSVSVICSDKTGTLTQNKMHVVSTYANGEMNGSFDEDMLFGMSLCNDAKVQEQEIIGEPTEKALVAFVEQQGIHKHTLELDYVRVNEIPFDSQRKLMTTVHKYRNGYVSFTKGALERILDRCTHIQLHGEKLAFSAYEKSRIMEASRQMSEQALRVLAIAKKPVRNPMSDNLESGLILLGLVGLIDPPREEVKESIAIAHKAGIEVVMITGDHPLTALAIARQLDIAKYQQEVCTGADLDAMNDQELGDVISRYHVFARVTPQHKVRIVRALKANEQVVAMSGDGVNDAPSLKNADIGIAMGKSGTDVCKQASDMILADDNFATIVKAVEEGRNIYLNIQKAVLYLLSCNLGEIMSLFLTMVLMPHVVSTLSAVQILWVNMVTDAFPALALGVDPKDRYIMEEKPRNAKESLFAHGGWMFTILNGMLIGTITMVAFRYGLNSSPEKARTMAFMVLSISQLFHAMNLTSRTHSLFQVGIFKNKWLILTVFFGIALQVMVASLPFFQMLLKTVSLDVFSWGIVFSLAFSPILLNEASKWIAHER